MSVPPPLPAAKRGWRHRLGWSAALAVLGAGATVLYHAAPYAEDSLLPACPFHAVTGLYCPGCGMTRCLHSLLHLDVGAAMAANPLLVVLLPVLGLLALRLAGIRPARIEPMMRRLAAPWPWLLLLAAYGVLRNLPWLPFTLLAPG